MNKKVFVSPASDPQFATNHVHGVNAQRECFHQALRYTKGARTAIDIGAHIGIWTDAMAAKFTKVVAFEPVAENFQCLTYNLRDRTNALLYRGALGGPVPLSLPHFISMTMPPKGNSGMWRLDPRLETVPGSDVPFAPLDSFGLSNVDLIKMDVEGFEGHVVDGARQTLTESSPVVVFEDNGIGPRHFGKGWLDPKPILISLGYKKKFRWAKDEIWAKA